MRDLPLMFNKNVHKMSKRLIFAINIHLKCHLQSWLVSIQAFIPIFSPKSVNILTKCVRIDYPYKWTLPYLLLFEEKHDVLFEVIIILSIFCFPQQLVCLFHSTPPEISSHIWNIWAYKIKWLNLLSFCYAVSICKTHEVLSWISPKCI